MNNIDQNIVVKEVLKGHTIFFGEEHLNISRCMFEDGQSFPYVVTYQNGSTNPSDNFRVDDPTDFAFPRDKPPGLWYLSQDGVRPYVNLTGSIVLAFYAQEPVFRFDVWNADTDTKIENNTPAYRGNILRFKYAVDTKLDDITTRPDYDPSKGYMNLKVISADGNEHLNLMTLEPSTLKTVVKNLTNLDVNPSPAWSWPENLVPSNGIGWWTGFRIAQAGLESDYEYPLGNYTVVGLCNVNNMFKNRQVQLRTWDEKSFNLVQRPLSITVGNIPVGRDKEFTATVSGLPNTTYQLFINDQCPPKITGKFCDRPPFIIGDRQSLAQKGIVLDPIDGVYRIGSTDVIDCCKEGMKIRQIVPSGDDYPSNGGWEIFENGTRYYAEVTTGSDGTAIVPFWVDTTMNAATYTLQVQDVNFKQKATAEVPITMGSITASTKSTNGVTSSVFYVGDEIWIDGTNTDSNTSYLWITGPGLDPCGVNLYDPTSHDPVKAVVYDSKNGVANSWRISPNWATNDTPISAGNYTIWITSSNPGSWSCTNATCLGIAEEKGVCAIQKCPSCAVYTSIPVTLLQPELTLEPVDTVQRCCCPGYPCGQLGGVNEIWLNGTSGGDNCKELQIWMFGQGQFGTKNYLYTETPTFCDDTFNFELNKGLLQPNNIDLCEIPSGVYDVIVQVPGANGMFDVNRAEPEANGDRFVTTTLPVAGSKIFKVEGKDAITDGIAVKLLKEGLNKRGIDDKYVHIQITIDNKPCEGTVDFTADRTSGNENLTVQFTDKSVHAVSWIWSVNGVQFSVEQNPRYTFALPGKYTIKLEATDKNGLTNSVVKESYITIISQPIADFSFGPIPIAINDLVQFTDQSTGSPTSWMWNFGDGNSSSLQSPTHMYSKPGIYTVNLSVSNSIGIGLSKSKNVEVMYEKPTADFLAYPQESVYYPATVTFTDTSTGHVTGWLWKLETEGKTVATSAEQNPLMTISEPGTYNVSLTVSNNGGSDTLVKNAYITIGIGKMFQLLPGWNHISVPQQLKEGSDTIGTLFAGVDFGGYECGIYDNSINNWTNVSSDYKVKPLQAIRVYSTQIVDINPEMVKGASFTRFLKQGWEGIGIVAEQPVPAKEILSSLGESWDKIIAFNAKTQRWEYPIIRDISDTQNLYPGAGYLIEMNSEGNLTNGGVQ